MDSYTVHTQSFYIRKKKKQQANRTRKIAYQRDNFSQHIDRAEQRSTTQIICAQIAPVVLFAIGHCALQCDATKKNSWLDSLSKEPHYGKIKALRTLLAYSLFSTADQQLVKVGMGETSISRNPVGTLRKVDPYGFEIPEDFDHKSYENFESEYLGVLAHRLQRWDEKVFDHGKKKSVKHVRMLKRFCRKGIPGSYRCLVWMDVSGATKLLNSNPAVYDRLKSFESETSEDQTLKESIKTDLNRTFPDNIHFQSQMENNQSQHLYNILIAFGRHRPEIGYCQGMNYIAALLYLVVKDEEKSFWLLVTLLDNILPQYYTDTMAELRAELHVLSELVRKKFPNVQKMMDRENIPWTLIASKWFICIFIDILPIETVLRIWDCLFYEGNKILFRVALMIIKDKEDEVKQCSGMPDIIESFKNLKNDDRALECHHFIKDCLTDTNPLTRAEITKLRKKHLAIVKEEDSKLRKKI